MLSKLYIIRQQREYHAKAKSRRTDKKSDRAARPKPAISANLAEMRSSLAGGRIADQKTATPNQYQEKKKKELMQTEEKQPQGSESEAAHLMAKTASDGA